MRRDNTIFRASKILSIPRYTHGYTHFLNCELKTQFQLKKMCVYQSMNIFLRIREYEYL